MVEASSNLLTAAVTTTITTSIYYSFLLGWRILLYVYNERWDEKKKYATLYSLFYSLSLSLFLFLFLFLYLNGQKDTPFLLQMQKRKVSEKKSIISYAPFFFYFYGGLSAIHLCDKVNHRRRQWLSHYLITKEIACSEGSGRRSNLRRISPLIPPTLRRNHRPKA